MIRLAEQPPQQETAKSFDPLASINMFRYDLEHFNQVLPETRERVQDEELSYLVEGIDKAARTVFPLRQVANDLQYFKNGKWQSYTAMLLTGREVAQAEAQADHRKQFLADDAVNDLHHGYKMRSLEPGQQHVWASSYPYDVEQRYGSEFMRQSGRFPDRKMGFVYRAYCQEAGTVILESQTVDRSDDEAFAAALLTAESDRHADMDSLVQSYDDVLRKKHGVNFYAGRKGIEGQENAWHTLLEQRDLIQYFLHKLEAIAAMDLSVSGLEDMTKRHIYGVWAAFKQRIDGVSSAPKVAAVHGVPFGYYAMLEHEVRGAFRQFAAEGRVLVGCGGSLAMLQGESDILDAEGKDVFSSIFNSKSSSDSDDCEFISKKCPLCDAKNVKTTVTKTHVTGSCGCSKRK
jgi:hypothetical protein